MKLKNLILISCVLTLAVSSCKKEEGPAGKDGNANITSITITNPIVSGTVWRDTLPGVNFQNLATSLILPYIQDASCGTAWYSMPGWGCAADYAGRFYTSQAHASDSITTVATLQLLNPDGSISVNSFTISKLHIIIAPANVFVTGKKEIDFSDYNATCRYLGIKE